MTKSLEGNKSVSGSRSLWQTLTNLRALWKLNSSTEAGFVDINNSYGECFIAAVEHGLEKLSLYFEKLIIEPEVSSYVVASILHPALRFAWFQTK